MINCCSFIIGVVGFVVVIVIFNVFVQVVVVIGFMELILVCVQWIKILCIGVVCGVVLYYNKDLVSGEWGGFMIDFVRSLVVSLNVKLDIIEIIWGNLVLDLQMYKIDLFFGMNLILVCCEVIGFIELLFLNVFMVVFKKEFKIWVDLNKLEVKIVVDIGFLYDQMISCVCFNVIIVCLEKVDDVILVLQIGCVDVQVLVWLLVLNIFKKNFVLGKMYVLQLLEVIFINIGVFKEEDKVWVEIINKWIVVECVVGKIKLIVLGNLQKFFGVKLEDVLVQILL